MGKLRAKVSIVFSLVICLILVAVFFLQNTTLEEVLKLHERQGQHIEYLIHAENKSDLRVQDGDYICDTVYNLLDSIVLTRRVIPKRVAINGYRVMVYITTWDDGESPKTLPELEFIIDGDGNYTVNVGSAGFNIVSGTQVLDDFLTLIPES